MANTIQLAHSNTADETPSSLEAGEVAINSSNRKIWVGNGTANQVIFQHADYLQLSGGTLTGALSGTTLTTSDKIHINSTASSSTVTRALELQNPTNHGDGGGTEIHAWMTNYDLGTIRFVKSVGAGASDPYTMPRVVIGAGNDVGRTQTATADPIEPLRIIAGGSVHTYQNTYIEGTAYAEGLGLELCHNRQFHTGDLTGWTDGDDKWSVTGSGTAAAPYQATSSGEGGLVMSSIGVAGSTSYLVSFRVTGRTTGSLGLRVGDSTNGSEYTWYSGNGTNTATLTTGSGSQDNFILYPLSGWDGNVDNVSVRKVNTTSLQVNRGNAWLNGTLSVGTSSPGAYKAYIAGNTCVSGNVIATGTVQGYLGNFTGALTGTTAAFETSGLAINLDTPDASQNCWVTWNDNGTAKWEIGKNTANKLYIHNYAASATALEFDSSSHATFGGALTVSGAAAFNTISSNLVGSISTLFDLGTSSLKWRNLNMSGTATIGGNITLDSATPTIAATGNLYLGTDGNDDVLLLTDTDATFSTGLTVDATSTLNADVNITGDIGVANGRGVRGPSATESMILHTTDGVKFHSGGNTSERLRLNTDGTHNHFGNRIVNSQTVSDLHRTAEPSLRFNGGNATVTTTGVVFAETEPWSYGFTCKKKSINQGDPAVFIQNTGNSGIVLYNATVSFRASGSYATAVNVTYLDKWTSLFFVADGAGSIKVYQDGVEIGDLDVSGLTGGSGTTFSGFSCNANGSPNWVFEGECREFSLHNRALEDTEVAALYNGEPTPWKYADPYRSKVSDFSAGTDGWGSGGASALDGNIDIGGRTDTLRFTCNSISSTHYMLYQHGGDWSPLGRRVRISFDYYVPSGQSNIDGIGTFHYGPSGEPHYSQLNETDDWTSVTLPDFDVPQATSTGNGLSYGFIIFAADGGGRTFTDSGNDVFYIKNFKYEEVGEIAAYTPQSITSGEWRDTTSNANHGAVIGATMVGFHDLGSIHVAQDGKVGEVTFSGNIGSGRTPKTDWHSSYAGSAIEQGQSSAIFSHVGGDTLFLSSNYYAKTDGDKYITDGRACDLRLDAGEFKFRTSNAVGTAGGAIGWNSVLTIGTDSTATFGDTVTVGGNLMPSVDNGCYLGNASYRWAGLSVSGAAQIDGNITQTAGVIVLNDGAVNDSTQYLQYQSSSNSNAFVINGDAQGRVAIGAAVSSYTTCYIGNTMSHRWTGGTGRGMWINPGHTPNVSQWAYGEVLRVQGAITEGTDPGVQDPPVWRTHPWFRGTYFQPPTITAGTATVDNSAVVYIEQAMSCATANYAFYVNSGNSYFGGGIASNLLPSADNAYALGNASYRWSSVNAAGNFTGDNAILGGGVTAGSTISTTGNITAGGTLAVTSTASIGALLTVTNAEPKIRLTSTKNDQSWALDGTDTFGSIEFYSSDTSLGGPALKGKIACLPRNATGGSSHLAFYVRQEEDASDPWPLVEKLRIDQAGRFGFGTSSPAGDFHFKQGPDNRFIIESNGPTLIFKEINSTDQNWSFYHNAGVLYLRTLADNYGSISDKVWFLNNGNVGIGATPGNYKLYVNGSSYLTGEAKLGGIDMSDGGDFYDNVSAPGTAGQVLHSGGDGNGVYWGTDDTSGTVDNSVSEVKLKVSNGPTDGYVLVAQSAESGGLTWEARPHPVDKYMRSILWGSVQSQVAYSGDVCTLTHSLGTEYVTVSFQDVEGSNSNAGAKGLVEIDYLVEVIVVDSNNIKFEFTGATPSYGDEMKVTVIG